MTSKEFTVEGYERIIHIEHDESGLDAFIVIHNTTLGPAIGGIRCHNYSTNTAQLDDAMRLSEGMTFKNAAAGLNHGGGKTTINASPQNFTTSPECSLIILMAISKNVLKLSLSFSVPASPSFPSDSANFVYPLMSRNTSTESSWIWREGESKFEPLLTCFRSIDGR